MTTKEYFEVSFGLINLGILCVTAYFIYRSISSPVKAVKIGRELDSQQQKDNTKRNLFLLLFSLRATPVHYDFVRGLNQIDIVYEDTPSVLAAWHTLFDSLENPGQVNAPQTWERLRVNLFSTMAVSLGYSRVQQTDMIRTYSPVSHGDQIQYDIDFREAVLTYLRSGSAAFQLLVENTPKREPDKIEKPSL
jgi:hypothetical protein